MTEGSLDGTSESDVTPNHKGVAASSGLHAGDPSDNAGETGR